MKIGIAGTGRMGTAIAQRLIELDHEVRVWNRTADNASEARDAGAKWTPALSEMVNESEVVISVLFDDAAVKRVYLGPNGLLTGHVEGRLFVDMSTVSPDGHRRIAPAMASSSRSASTRSIFSSTPTTASASRSLPELWIVLAKSTCRVVRLPVT